MAGSTKKEIIKSIARIAVTAAISPGATLLAVGREGAGWGIDVLHGLLGGSDRRSIDQLVAGVSRDLEDFAASEGLPDAGAPILKTAEDALRSAALSSEELHDRELDPDRAARTVWRRSGSLATGLSEAEQGLVVQVLAKAYDALVSNLAQLEAMELAFRRTVLRRLRDLDGLAEEVVDALRSAAADALLVPGYRSWRRGEAPPSALLRAEYEVVPFHGREQELTSLDEWCEADPELKKAIRLYTGEGGMGKTRLMLQACRRRRLEGWKAGFLADVGVNGLPRTALDTVFGETVRPLFVVIDYAERRMEGVARVLEALADAHPSQPIRVVLLARNASLDEGWWRELIAGSLLLQASPQEPHRLGPLVASDEERGALFSEAATRLATRIEEWGVLADDDLTDVDPSPPVPDLSEDLYRRALFLHLRAFAAVLGDHPESADDLLDFLRRREEDFWSRRAATLGLDLAAGTLIEAAVLLTLAGPLASWTEAREVLQRLPALSGEKPDPLRRLADLFHDLYPARTWLHGVQPDLLGERLVEAETTRDQSLLEAALGPEVPEDQKEAALTVLARIARRREETATSPQDREEIRGRLAHALRIDPAGLAGPAIRVTQETGEVLGAALADVLPDTLSPEEARRLEALLPFPTVALREVAVLITQKAVYGLEDPDTEKQFSKEARLLNNLSNRLADLGDREAARDAIQKAVVIYRQLADQRPDAFRPDLATSLNNLSVSLADLGDREAARDAIEEAVEIRRQIADQRPDAFRPDLASSLNNLSNRLADMGDREAARDAILEAVEIYRQLADQRPDAFRPELATCLNNLSVHLADLGDREAARDASQEAVEISRQLADQRPDAFRSKLASSLNNLSISLAGLGDREAARGAIQEAVEIYRQLADQRPDAFRPDLAISLNNLSLRLAGLGDREAARGAIQEAVEIYRQLADQRPDAFRPDLAMSLNNLSNRLADLGDHEGARDASQEAVEIYRPLADQRPDVFRPDLAGNLNTLSNCLADLGEHEAARNAIQEAVEICRQLAKQRPDAFRPDLAMSLNNLSNRLADLGDREAARDAIQEAVEIRRQLAEQRPDVFRPDLAGSLNNLSLRLADLGDREAALDASQEAVSCLKPYFLAHPAAFDRRMDTMVRVYLERIADMDQKPDPDLLEPILPLLDKHSDTV